MNSKESLALDSDQQTTQEGSLWVRKLFVGLSVAAAICVALSILNSSKSGGKIRKDLSDNMTNTAKKMKNTVAQGAETVKDSAEKAGHDVHTAIKRDFGRMEDAKNDIRHGYRKVAKVINKTATNISKDLN